jgi:hypothetical protein
MYNEDLAKDYIKRAGSRLRALDVLMAERSWADVVRESQEIVEITLKALLRACRIEVPQGQGARFLRERGPHTVGVLQRGRCGHGTDAGAPRPRNREQSLERMRPVSIRHRLLMHQSPRDYDPLSPEEHA